MNLSSDDDVLDAHARCLAGYAVFLATSRDRPALEIDGVVAGNPGLSPRARNMVVPTRALDPDEAGTVVQSLIDFYGSALTWMIWTIFPTDFSSAGLVHLDSNPAMVRAPAVTGTPLGPGDHTVPGLEITEVGDDAGVAVFERTRDEAREGFPGLGVPGATPLDARSLSGRHRMWIGSIDGVPVGTAAMFSASGISLIKYVATVPAYRRRGIGAALSVHAVRATDLPAVLDADPGAHRLYETLGFRVTGDVHLWGFPAAG